MHNVVFLLFHNSVVLDSLPYYRKLMLHEIKVSEINVT